MDERDAQRLIFLVSDDGGLTWYPKGGNAALAAPADASALIRLVSSDTTNWTTT